MSNGSASTKRETFKETPYFDKLIQSTDEWLVKFDAKITDPTTAPEHRRQLRHTVFRNRLEQLIARYSRGDTVESLRELFPPIVASLAAYQTEPGHAAHDFEELDAYVYGLWLVSLAILLDVEDPVFQTLLPDLDNDGRDGVYERLVSLRAPGRPLVTALLYPKTYQPLFDALNATGETRTNLILKFLKGYYKGMRQTYWHDSHLGENAGFFGYWCFELAAFVKKLGIDDAAFADNIFYPVDLVRWRS